jgi:hypothetical protein
MEISLAFWIPIVQGVVTIVALGVGAYVALTGLNTWKAQARAKIEYELARRVMGVVYKIRDSISKYRRDSMAEWFGSGLQVDLDMDKFQNEFRQRQTVSLTGVTERARALDIELLEAEGLWGENIIEPIRQFQALAFELQGALSEFYMPGPQTDRKDELWAVLLHDLSWREDDFDRKVNRRLEEVKKALRPKMTFR